MEEITSILFQGVYDEQNRSRLAIMALWYILSDPANQASAKTQTPIEIFERTREILMKMVVPPVGKIVEPCTV